MQLAVIFSTLARARHVEAKSEMAEKKAKIVEIWPIFRKMCPMGAWCVQIQNLIL